MTKTKTIIGSIMEMESFVIWWFAHDNLLFGEAIEQWRAWYDSRGNSNNHGQ